MGEIEFLDWIRKLVQEGLAELDAEEHRWASRRIVEPRPIEVEIPGGDAESVGTMWPVTDFVDGGSAEYRLVYDPALVTFGLISAGTRDRPVLIGLYGDFAETVRSV